VLERRIETHLKEEGEIIIRKTARRGAELKKTGFLPLMGEVENEVGRKIGNL